MITFGCVGAQLCVVGPAAPDLASPAFRLAELFARNVPTAYARPPCATPGAADPFTTLPNGRTLPVWPADQAPLVSVWAGPGADLPPAALRLVWADPDSPDGDAALAQEADLFLVPDAAAAARIGRPASILPLAAGLDALLARATGDAALQALVPTDPLAALASSVGALLDPAIADFRGALYPPSAAARHVAEAKLGPRAAALRATRRVVCPAYDGGFFSVFNAFLSHLVWELDEHRVHAVLPDWNIDRTLAALPHAARSFCYGQPGDGNLWARLFQPLYGATDADMQDHAYLWHAAAAPADRHNEAREPTLTYVRAYTLYNSPDFAAVRRQYHRAAARHVRLRPELAAEIDAFAARHLAAPVRIAAHVRHPSHTVEQPGHRIAGADAYIARTREEVRRRGADPEGDGWVVFVATDQERVLRRFQEAFGARAVFYPDARRTRAHEDAVFEALPPGQRNRDGYQLQHLLAADPASWSWRLAWEVVRDAWTMARCQALLHVVSNVSTAVSYLNPDLDMIFCAA